VFVNIDQFSKESVASIFERGLLYFFCEGGGHNFHQNIFNHVLKYTMSYLSISILKIKDCCNIYSNKSTTARKLYNHMTSFLHVSAFFGHLQEGIRQIKTQNWLIISWMCSCRVKIVWGLLYDCIILYLTVVQFSE
jgi:hypothetical protein